MQLNHCDGVYSNYLKYLIKKLKTLAIHQFLCLDPPLSYKKKSVFSKHGFKKYDKKLSLIKPLTLFISLPGSYKVRK